MPRYWLSFDLGLKGNYDGLYGWLDNLKAKECGDSVATFTSDKTVERLQKELRRILGTSARVYLVYTHGKPSRAAGKFILGGRKAAPWSGFGVVPSEESDEA